MGGTLAIKPATITYEEAASVPTAGFEALHFVRVANLQPGQKVLIIGAGDSIGTFTVQLAKHYGAEVTAVDSTEKMDMLRSIGADQVTDYTREDYTKTDNCYDLIVAVVGKGTVARGLKLLKRDGNYFLAYAGFPQVLLKLWTSLTSRKKLRIESSSQSKEDLLFLKELIEAGKLKTVIDRSCPLEQTAEAHRYAESGQKKGIS